MQNTLSFPAVAICALLLGGCMTNGETRIDPRFQDVAPQALFDEASAAFAAGDRASARAGLEAFRAQYPFSALNAPALVTLAEIHYAERRFDNVEAITQEYLRLYPAEAQAERMQFLLGMSYAERIRAPEFDQSESLRAIHAMSNLISRFPDSAYSDEAKAVFERAVNNIADKEMSVATFYRERDAHQAALGRYMYVISNLRGTRAVPEALFRIAELKAALGDVGEAQTAVSLLEQHFPETEWAELGREFMEKIAGDETARALVSENEG